ncbi:hypothetical protein ANANG_G00251840 [Anguilla anguilla]|uniref:Uncharacterized protein n=1 Tax=Anguilla anguilla TaxID=7936 RepID=A0A9D3LTW0_ANGAN|nr:hypothetical protein ANANG_G00251840 [Anguilla anguilla]
MWNGLDLSRSGRYRVFLMPWGFGNTTVAESGGRLTRLCLLIRRNRDGSRRPPGCI